MLSNTNTIAALSTTSIFRAVAEPRRNPRIPERHTVALWLRVATPECVLRTMDGRELRVLCPGTQNQHDGPDFLGAEIILDGRLFRGAVEVHTDADDWWRHGHDRNTLYDEVILHVALYPPTRTDVLPPTVLLPGQLSMPLREAWSAEFHQAHPMVCAAGRGATVAHPLADVMLLIAAVRRYTRKCARMRYRYDQLSPALGEEGALRQAVWEAIARGAGYGGNQDRMERAARVLTLAGALALPPSRRACMLSAAAEKKTKDLSQCAMQDSWLNSAITPSNRAVPRLRWLASWAERLSAGQWWNDLDTAAQAFTGDAGVFAPLFRVEGEAASPGPERVTELAMNVLSPVLNLLSELRDNASLARRARAVYFTMRAAAPNRITRITAPVLGRTVPFDSKTQQGMIELYSEFCSPRKCGSCLLSD
ncbi:MAG: DUF2851 family protein [Bacteroidia bacterium]|nr:DUF2851 family protein [Bacteroidia bacterium]